MLARCPALSIYNFFMKRKPQIYKAKKAEKIGSSLLIMLNTSVKQLETLAGQ
jgi:hypothetical protein